MTNTAEEHQADDSNIIQLKDRRPAPTTLSGTKPPEETVWLPMIPEGYGFLVREKATMQQPKKSIGVFFMQVVGRTDKCTRLYNGDARQSFWVHTVDYSLANDCLDVITIVYPTEEEVQASEQQANGNSDRTV